MEQFIKPELLAIGGAIVLVFQVIWRVCLEAQLLPTIPKWLIPAALLPAALGLAFRHHQISPLDPAVTRTLADDWFIQATFLYGVMLTGWLAAVAAFSTPKADPGGTAAGENPMSLGH